jgi:hypothetical protein
MLDLPELLVPKRPVNGASLIGPVFRHDLKFSAERVFSILRVSMDPEISLTVGF